MAAPPQRRTPTYAVNSVDKALRLLQILRDIGEIRVKDAAAELGVSPSTVHRLMSMLVFRGFAVQDASHIYLPGPALDVPVAHLPGTKGLHSIAKPHLTALRDVTGETAYGMILAGRLVRCILTVESSIPAAAGDRHGLVLPAETSAAGHAMLAALPDEDVERLFRAEGTAVALPSEDFARLRTRIDLVRARGYSIMEVESGLISVAVPLRRSDVHPPMSVSISAPSGRAAGMREPEIITRVIAARDAIDREFAAARRRGTVTGGTVTA